MAMRRLQITLKSWLQGNSQALSDLRKHLLDGSKENPSSRSAYILIEDKFLIICLLHKTIGAESSTVFYQI